MIVKIDKSVRQVETNDIGAYISDYENESNAGKVTLDNIRRIISSFFAWLELVRMRSADEADTVANFPLICYTKTAKKPDTKRSCGFMVYSELVRRACSIMYDAHKDDVDKGGYPYVFHPFYLAAQMEDEESVCTALLHDVIEDHGDRYSLDGLERAGFPASVIHALRLLTHGDGVPYMDYVEALAEDPIARKVKAADLRHNMDASRLGGVRAKKYDLYVQALHYLEEKA